MTVFKYHHYIPIIQLLGRVAIDMSKRRVKCDDKGYLYYDGPAGNRIYIGKKDMVNKKSFTIEGEAELDMKAIWGRKKRPRCAFCNGYGIWPEDSVPLLPSEADWAMSDECKECGSNNHVEYMEANSGCSVTPPWQNTKSIGFHAAMKRFKRSASCVESLDTQVAKTAQE